MNRRLTETELGEIVRDLVLRYIETSEESDGSTLEALGMFEILDMLKSRLPRYGIDLAKAGLDVDLLEDTSSLRKHYHF